MQVVVERLYPLEWDMRRGAHLMGGPGVMIRDDSGQSLVHAGWIHDGAGLLPGKPFLVRRSYENGELEWDYRGDAQFSGVDVSASLVYANLVSAPLPAPASLRRRP